MPAEIATVASGSATWEPAGARAGGGPDATS